MHERSLDIIKKIFCICNCYSLLLVGGKPMILTLEMTFLYFWSTRDKIKSLETLQHIQYPFLTQTPEASQGQVSAAFRQYQASKVS